MNRRDIIIVLCAAMILRPVVVGAEQSTMPVIGFLNSASSAEFAPLVAAFRQGLSETGHVEGKNVTIEYRWAGGHHDRLPTMASDLVVRGSSVIVATGGAPAALAATAATSTIPVVFAVGADAVMLGLVASLNRPGGNATGVAMFAASLWEKCLQLLIELVPNAAIIGALIDHNDPYANPAADAVQAVAHSLGRQLLFVTVNSETEIDAAFAALVERHVDALLVSPAALFTNRRDKVVAVAARYALPTIYQWQEYAIAGGLMTYGTSLSDTYRQVGVYAGRILHGAKPADLPVVQPSAFHLVINLKTAKALGLAVPPSLLAQADEVIE
jgi:putative tryptophan/tyrosine transport system substrate-binding protein